MTKHRIGIAALVLPLFVAASALANHDHPFKANKLLVTFVRAMTKCTSPTHAHDAPLAFPACSPVSSSPALSFGPAGFGQLTMTVKLDPGKLANDVLVKAKLADVRVGDDGTGPGFDGYLTITALFRDSDHDCDGSSTPCTMTDAPIAISLPCGSAASTAAGKCTLSTTLNVVLPGSVLPNLRANWEIGQVQIYQGSDLAFVQGLYLP